MIYLILEILMAWFIPHLMASNSTSVVVTLTAQWIVLAIGLSYKWMCEIEVAMLFLILASKMTIDEKKSKEALIMALSRFLIWFLISQRQW